MPILEPGLEDMLNACISNINFKTIDKLGEEDSDCYMVCVGTPQRDNGSADLSYIMNTIKELLPILNNNSLVVIKSTVPPGTCNTIDSWIRAELPEKHISVAPNPEFLSQGTAVRDAEKPSRIIIGIGKNDLNAEVKLKEIYKDYKCPIIVTDRKTSELAKYASNNLLSLKISYMNELANYCDIIGADITDIKACMSKDERIGEKFLNAGIGYGGSCFVKDAAAYSRFTGIAGQRSSIVEAGLAVNNRQWLRIIKKAEKYFKKLSGLNCAVLGITYKPETDDVRTSPSIRIISNLIGMGVNVTVYDPSGYDKIRKIFPDIKCTENPEDCLVNADFCMILTEWEEIKKISGSDFKRMKHPVIFDGRNCLNKQAVESADHYEGIGIRK